MVLPKIHVTLHTGGGGILLALVFVAMCHQATSDTVELAHRNRTVMHPLEVEVTYMIDPYRQQHVTTSNINSLTITEVFMVTEAFIHLCSRDPCA